LSDTYTPLHGGAFFESFLLEVRFRDWPNDLEFLVWSTRDHVAYRILAEVVLEYHHIRTGIGRLEGEGEGIPLDNIYRTYEEEFSRWKQKMELFSDEFPELLLDERNPVCLEFSSHLFGNRKWERRADRNTGVLVVCRRVSVQEEYQYSGPQPYPHRIPSKGRR
jgi:hypothetical protein